MDKLILFLVRIIPRTAGVKFFMAVGSLLYYLMPNRRKTAYKNLEIAFGNSKSLQERQEIAKKCFRNSLALGFDFFKILQMPKEKQQRYVEIVGEENLKSAVDMKRGVIAVSAHFGNFPLMLAWMSLRGYRVNVVTRRIRLSWANELYTGMLNRFGTGTITKEKIATGIMRALKNGEIVGYVLDQNMQSSTGIFVDFFGEKASTLRGLATFAGRNASPIISARIISTLQKHTIIIEKPYMTGKGIEDELILTQKFTSIIQGWIIENPEQWMWFHRRFKTRPEGSERIYPVKPSLTKRFRRWKRKRNCHAGNS